MWILCELPDLGSVVHHASFYPCGVSGACHSPEPWPVSWFTAMFMHGSWDHILGNMLFLAIFGKNVEDAFGRGRYLAFYCAGGFAANAMQTGMTLAVGSAAAAKVPVLAQAVRSPPCSARTSSSYPGSRVLTIVLIFPVRIPAFIYLGLWFLYQLVAADYDLFSASANGAGTAFFSHIGGFLFGILVAWVYVRRTADERSRSARPILA